MSPVEQALRELGLTEPAARLYMDLLRTGTVRATAAEPAARELLSAGLAVENAGYLTATDPTPSVKVLGDQRLAEVDEAARRLMAVYEQSGRAGVSAGHGVVALSADTADTRVRRAVAHAAARVRILDAAPLLDVDPPAVAVSVVYSAEALRAGRATTGATVTKRLLAELPVRLHLVDGELGFVAGAGGHAVVVHAGPVLDAVVGLFDVCWRLATPLHPGGPLAMSAPPHAADRRLLAMLDAGLNDEAVCAALGIGRRTFYRRLGALMARTSTTNRFRLAAQAVRAGWI